MIFSCVSQVNIYAGQTGALSMVLAENERTSRQQQQNRWNDKKQFFHRQNLQFKYSVPSWDAKKSHGETRFPVGRARLPMIEKPAQAGFAGLLPLAATLPLGGSQGEQTSLTCAAVHIPGPNLRRDRTFNAAADLL